MRVYSQQPQNKVVVIIHLLYTFWESTVVLPNKSMVPQSGDTHSGGGAYLSTPPA